MHDALTAAGITAAADRLDQFDVPAVQAVLSPGLYLDYQQALALEHTALNRLVSRLGQPLSAARQIIAIRDQTRRDQAAVSADNTLSVDQRTARLNALVEAAATRVGGILGPGGLEAYRQSSGAWLQSRSFPVLVPR